MITAIARFATRWWWVVVGLWIGGAVVLTVVSPSFHDVAVFDEAVFLPDGSAAVAGEELLEHGWPEDNYTRVASLVLVREEGELSDTDEHWAAGVVDWLESDPPAGVGDVMTHLREAELESTLTSDDGQAMVVVVGFDVPTFTPQARDAVAAIRHHVHDRDPPPGGLDAYVSGAAAISADEDDAIESSMERATLLSVVVVIVILLWVFRSPVAPLVPFTVIVVSFLVSLGAVSLAAEAGLQVSGLYETLSLVIIFGAGTDYGLLMVSRYREELALGRAHGYAHTSELRRRTTVATAAVLGAVIASSAGTVMVGFSAMSVADFGLYRTMGPAMALAIAITLAAGLTLTPALMRMLGPWLLWPHRRPRHERTSDRPLIDERADQLGFHDDEPARTYPELAEGVSVP